MPLKTRKKEKRQRSVKKIKPASRSLKPKISCNKNKSTHIAASLPALLPDRPKKMTTAADR